MSKIDYQIRFSQDSSDLRNQEHFYFVRDGNEQKLVLQNYAEIYRIPLLYEQFCDKALYQSPETLAMLLASQSVKSGFDLESLVILDIAAGSGLFG